MNLLNMIAASGNRVPTGTEEGVLKRASFTLLDLHAKCNYAAFLRQSIPYKEYQEKSEPNPNADRGTELHDATEQFVKGYLPSLPKEIKYQREYIESCRRMVDEGKKVYAENPWYFDKEWTPQEKEGHRLVLKLDQYYFETPNIMVIDEWKSGKAIGNEAKHVRQTKFYATGAFMKFPDLQLVNTYVRYFDQNFVLPRSYTREQSMAFHRTFDNQLRLFWHDTKYQPRPSRAACGICPYNAMNTDGSYFCAYGVRND